MALSSQIIDRIDKLNGANYRSWKFNMKMTLVQRELWQHITGEASLPVDHTPEEGERFKNKENKALATIALGVEPEHQIHILDCEKASDAWEALQRIFEPKSRARILQLKKQMLFIKLESSETMNSYLARLKTCSDSLKEVGYEFRDDDLAYAMLSGLPDAYDGIVMTLANLDDDKFKSTEIKEILMNEYERRAMKKVGHTQDQPKEAYHQAKESSKEEKRKCFKCNKIGHLANNCNSKSVNTKGNRKRWTPNTHRNNNVLLLELNNTQLDDSWLIDSGATHHVCKHREWFAKYKPITSKIIYSADSNSSDTLKAIGVGDIDIQTYIGNRKLNLTLINVYHVPNIRRNLLSVSQIEKKRKRLMIDNGKLKIQNKESRMIVGEALCKDGLYIVKARVLKSANNLNQRETNVAYTSNLSDSERWHQRFCHINMKNIQELCRKDLVRGLDNVNIPDAHCHNCSISKTTKAPCKRLGDRQTKSVLELIHSDLCGPMPMKSIGGARYILTFTDDYTRKVTVYCLKSKDEVVEYVRKYIARVERETDKKIKRFRSDNGLEYCNKTLKRMFDEMGIKHERTNVDTPQMNGIAERINRTLLDLVRAMLKSAELPERFWAEAVVTACYIKNRDIHSSINDVPERIWTGNKPSVKHLKVYGCLAYAYIIKQGRQKLDSRGRECILVGYSTQTKGYRLWDPIKGDIIQTKHIEFVEDTCGHDYIYSKRTLETPFNTDNIDETDDRDDIDADSETIISETCEENVDNKVESSSSQKTASVEKRKVGRPKKVVKNPWGCLGKPKNIELNLTEIIEPTNYEEAILSSQSNEWKAAMNEELKSLDDRNTWEIVSKPESISCIGSKWVYKVKTDSTGKIARYRARLVAQGFSQKKDIDYSESYAPVANFSLIRMLISISISHNWIVHHLDIKCAYLYGKLKEEIYMRLPPGYKDYSLKIAKLLRPIYGLKQSGRNWNNAIDEFLIKNGFERFKANNCVYTYGNDLILTLYVDDIILFAQSIDKVNEVKTLLMSEYEIRDLGRASYLLGINIKYEGNKIRLSQSLYIDKLLSEYGMDDCKTSKIPIDPGLKLSKCNSPHSDIEKDEMKDIPYKQLIGSLMYVALATRPDILFAVTKLSQFSSNPGRAHWLQAKRVLRYLAATKENDLVYHCGTNELEIFSDADWASDIDDRHSYSGMIIILNGNPIIWKSNKQKSISTSTMEAEYVALEVAVKEAIWLSMMFDELAKKTSFDVPSNPYLIRCDNKSAIDFTRNKIERSRTKHIDIAYHITREMHEKGLIELKYIPSGDNVADILTKPLPHTVINKHVEKLGLR